MKKIFLVLCFLLIVLVIADKKQVVIERPINLNCLSFEFFPCDINDSIIRLNCASLKKYSESQTIIECLKIKYVWENNTLYRADKNLGCYKIVCISWDYDKFDILGDSK